MSSLWTSASLIYDRHHLYKKISDHQLAAKVGLIIYKNNLFNRPETGRVSIIVFNKDVLLSGYIVNKNLYDIYLQRINNIKGSRRIINQVTIAPIANSSWLYDSWLTTKINSNILADAGINPNDFKVFTDNKIVYLMGDVIASQADKVIQIARNTTGVSRVVKLFRYYSISNESIKQE